MACLTGSDERAVNGLRTIVFQRPSCEIGQRAAGFVHQKVGSCKIPLMATRRRKSCVERALRHACEPESERMDFWLCEGAVCQLGESIEVALGSGDLRAAQSIAVAHFDRGTVQRCA